jgi:hypothetical protein
VQVLLLHKRLEEELELHSVLETAVAHVPGTLTSFPYHLPIAVRVLSNDCCPFYRKKIVLCLIAHVAQWQRLNGSDLGGYAGPRTLGRHSSS